MNATSNKPNPSNKRQSHAPKFTKVFDGRKNRIRGVWLRGDKFYAQLQFQDDDSGKLYVRRVPLTLKDGTAVATVPQAVEAMARMKDQRAEDTLPVLNLAPKFKDYVVTYIAFIKSGQESGQAMKQRATIEKEDSVLAGWVEHMGGSRLDKIRQSHINAYKAARLQAGMSRRTVNLDVIVLRNLLKHAVDERLIKVLPTLNMRPLKCAAPKRDLFTAEDLETLCRAAVATKEDGSPVTKNGIQFRDYLRFMAYSGTRRNEALGAQWDDVDTDLGQLKVRRQVTPKGVADLKNLTERTVDLNPRLKALLEEMDTRKVPDSKWIFPSPQRGEKDIPAHSFRESLELVRDHVKKDHPKLVKKAFHDLRHYFISMCVMSGLDYMTIAEWVGHKDGGVLIGKVYGHLANQHKKEMAAKVNFGPVVLQAVG